MIEGILHGVYETIDKLMAADPNHDSPEGILLYSLAKAVAEYEDYLYPELNLKEIPCG